MPTVTDAGTDHPWSVVVLALVVVLVVVVVLVLVEVDARRIRRRAQAEARALAVLDRALAAEVEGPGRWLWIVEAEARQIEARGAENGRTGYGALLVTWRQVADTLPRDVVDVVEGRPPVDPTRDPATGFRVIRHRAGTIGP